MPTLVRFITTLAVLAAIAWGAAWALATFVVPHQGEMSVRVPIEQPGVKSP